MAKTLHCIKCGHEWIPKEDGNKPNRCPNQECRTTKWEDTSLLNPKEEHGRLPGLSQQEKDNAERTLIKAIKDPEWPQKLDAIRDITVNTPLIKGSLHDRMMATGTWEPKPMWDMEKELIRDCQAGMGDSGRWKADFKEWFITAFNLSTDMPWSTHEKFLARGDPRRKAIQESILNGFGTGLAEYVDAICDDVEEQCKKWKRI